MRDIWRDLQALGLLLHPFDLADTIARMRDEWKLSQREIAHKTGKPESEISRFLALLNLEPDIQREARDDTSGDIGRRRLVAISQLPADEQREALDEVRAKRLSAEETEQMVQGKIVSETEMPKRGSPMAHGKRFKVGPATVEVTIRKKNVTPADIIAALERALVMARKEMEHEGTRCPLF